MSSNLRKDVDFKGLFRKLGHNLGEIRVRALKNILSKLDHGLVCDEDLVHEKQLYIRLLEWFNLPDCSNKEDVLCLLNKLTQHSVGSRLLQDIGGVEFLTQLRSDIEPCHRPVIDQILDSAMHLPDLASETQAPECIYQRPSDSAVWGASLSSVGDGSRLQMSQNHSDAVGHQRHHYGGGVSNDSNRNHHHFQTHHRQQQGFFGSPQGVSGGGNTPAPGSTPSATSLNPLEILQPLGTPDNHLFRLSTFPWLPLTQTDQQVIASTNGSLQTKDPSLLSSACEFLGDVVFQDFPAEIFLQRPEILKSLLSLISLPSTSDVPVVVQACKTLTTYTKRLQARIRFFQDPVFYTSKQEFNSTSVSGMSSSSTASSHVVPPPASFPARNHPSNVGLSGWGGGRRRRGDGQDGDSSTSVSQESSVGLEPDSDTNLNDDLDIEDTPLLQSQQLTLPQLCVAVLQRSLPRLRTAEQALGVSVLGLVENTLTILVCVVGRDVWSGSSDSARDVADRLTDCLETLSELLEFHHHSRHNNNASTTLPDPELGELSTHRVLYMGLVSTITKFLTMVPLEKMKAIIPERLKSSLCSIVFDESLALTNPHPRTVSLAVGQALDLSTSADFQLAADVCHSLTQTCKFCLNCDDGTTSVSELSEQAEKAIVSLPYHLHIPFVDKFVKFMSRVCSKKKTPKQTVTQCTNVLLSLLAYPVDAVRQGCYAAVMDVIRQSLQVSKATAPKSKDCLQSKFIMNPDLLYQMVSFGLADQLSSVRDNCTSILHHLLSSQLLMSEALWQELMTALTKSLPILQSYTDQSTALGKKLFSMLEPTTATHNIPLVEKLRGCLRILLLADKSLRLQSSKHIRWFLSNQQDKEGRLPTDLDLLTLEGCLSTKVTQMLDDGQSRSLFAEEGMAQVYDIFTSSPVDPDVKKSAGEQLAIMMKDPRLQASFREKGGLDVVCSVIQQVTKATSENDGDTTEIASSPRSNLPACLSILKNLTHQDYTLRHTLARDSDLLCCLVRVSLLHPTSEDVRSDVAQMLSLLLFDEVAKFDIGPGDSDTPGTKFSLPAQVVKRYRLPFKPSCHHVTSPSQVTLADERSDVMSLSGPREMMKICWNVAWQGGLEPLLDSIRTRLFSETKNEFSPGLSLSQVECTVLEHSSISWKLQSLHRATGDASTHQEVKDATHSMWLYTSVLQHTPCLLEFFSTTDWYSVLDRFLSVPPTSETDQSLLSHVLHFLSSALQCVSPHDVTKSSASSTSNPALVWLSDKLFSTRAPVLSLISRLSGGDKDSEDGTTAKGTNVKRMIDKEILSFITSLHCQLPYQLSLRPKFGLARGTLVKQLQDRLNITEAPHFYNLASLEGVLNCLMHVTARPGWSNECSTLDSLTLCSQLLNSLLEVVWSFHVGRGGSSRSYMGKGVTRATALCLRHLAYEMIQNSHDDREWVKNWLYTSHDVSTEQTQGLNWMLTLWAYRDPEVRAAGLGIAVAMTSSEVGRLLVTSHCKHIPGGIWGSALSIMLDPLECSLVCQQAAMVLVNLTSQPMPSGDLDPLADTWQGPMVTDADYQSVVVGVKALEALLEHTNLFSIVSTRIASLHTSAFVQPVLVTIETPFTRALETSNNTSSNNTSASSSTSDFATSSVEKTARTGLTNVSSVSGHMTLRSKAQSTEGASLSSSVVSSSSQACAPLGISGENVLPGHSTEAFHLTNQHQEGVASASFVSALVKLLSNLVALTPHMSLANMRAHSLLSSLVGLVRPQTVHNLIQEFSSEQTAMSPVALTLADVMDLYKAVARLLTSCVTSDTTSRLELLSCPSGLASLASLLLIVWPHQDDIALVCADLSTCVLQLFACMLHTQGLSTLNALTPVLGPIWPMLTESLCSFLSDSSLAKAKTLSASLDFVALLCCEEAKSVVKNPDRVVNTATISDLLDAPIGEENTEEKLSEMPTTGKQLCKVLVGAFEAVNTSDRSGLDSNHRLKLITAFKSLLAISQTAKAYALEAGIAETLVEHLKQTHAQLNLETLGLNKGKGKKEESYLKEVSLMFDLVRNFMCGNSEVKIACHHSGLTAVIHKMWVWCLQDHALMTSTLNLLVTYSAHCNSAASSFTSSPSSEVKVQPSATFKPSGPQGCVLAFLLKLAQSHIQRDECSPTLRLVFSILSNVAMNADCRNSLWKNPFLQQVSQLNPRKSKIRVLVAIDNLWCQLLLSLSFSIDGQQLLLKIPDILTVLMDLVEAGSSRCRQCAVLVIRNLCCHAPNKPKLLAAENFVGCLVGQIEQKTDDQSRLVAASALHALVHNNHKAKVQVKSSKVTPRILDALHKINSEGGQRSSPVADATCQNLKAVIENIRD